MLHTDIIDIKQKKLSVKDAEKFISSANYGASIICLLYTSDAADE